MPDPTRKTISATQVPALFDASPYLTRWMLWHWLKGTDVPEEAESNRMDWGKRMQPLILAQAAEDLKLEIRPNEADEYVAHVDRPIGCTVDAVTLRAPDRGEGVVETKCCFDYRVWMERWGGGEAPPRDIELQLQTQMATLGFGWGVIAVWIAGEVKYFERGLLPEVEQEIYDRAEQLFYDTANGIEPDAFGDPVEEPLLAKLFPAVDPTVVVDVEGDEQAELLAQYQWAKEQAGFHDKVAKQLRPKILALAGEAGKVKATATSGEVYWANISKSETAEKVITEADVGKVARKASVRTTLTVNKEGE